MDQPFFPIGWRIVQIVPYVNAGGNNKYSANYTLSLIQAASQSTFVNEK